MALTQIQILAYQQLSQSPMAFSVLEDTPIITSSSFQYIANLQMWRGDINFTSGAFDDYSEYTLAKFPNESGVGIFDVSRILNSLFQEPLESQIVGDVAAGSPWNYRIFAYTQYLSGSTFVTSSNLEIIAGGAGGYPIAYDGYQLYGEPINSNMSELTPMYPLMTDGPVTQSILDTSYNKLFVNGVSFDPPAIDGIRYTSAIDSLFVSVSIDQQDSYDWIRLVNGGGENSSTSIPINYTDWYEIQPMDGGVELGTGIRYEVVCPKKYDNVRIKWKNRFGAFDYFDFNLVSKQSFQTQTSQYQPQIGTWGGQSLVYNSYDTSIQNYNTDTKQFLSVNTDYVHEDYNNIFKQLLVSDEIYWIYNEVDYDIKPLTVTTSNITFKTDKVDKLIQYTFEFQYGQNYKLQL